MDEEMGWMKKHGVILDLEQDQLTFKDGFCDHPCRVPDPLELPSPKALEKLLNCVGL